MPLRGACASLLIGMLTAVALVAGTASNEEKTQLPANWDAPAAAKYMDARAEWWAKWPPSQRDHETVCISCHTTLPYVLARPKLTKLLKESASGPPDSFALANVQKRVKMWSEVSPFYLDSNAGPGKSRESRATESVVNALALASNAHETGELDGIARKAFQSAWALQLKSGPQAGAWDWQQFHLSPWEGSESQYQGACFMALAVGLAPDNYAHDREVRPNLKLLRAYLQREYSSQPLLNKSVLLWAANSWRGLLTRPQKKEIISQLRKIQRLDGGWSLPSLGAWARSDKTPEESDSDGYGTAIATLALAGSRKHSDENARAQGRAWLVGHQNKDDGSWRTSSLNKKREFSSDAGKFMSDAATGYAVIALSAR